MSRFVSPFLIDFQCSVCKRLTCATMSSNFFQGCTSHVENSFNVETCTLNTNTFLQLKWGRFRLWLLPSSTLGSLLARQALELGWSPMKERLDKQSSSCLHTTRCLWRPCAMPLQWVVFSQVVTHAVKEVAVVNRRPDQYLQSSQEVNWCSLYPLYPHYTLDYTLITLKHNHQVWTAVCSTVRKVLADGFVSKDQVVGIGFDATCSLVLVGQVGLFTLYWLERWVFSS